MTEQLHFHFSQSWKGMEPGVTLRSVWSKPCVSGQRQDTSQTQIASLVAWTVKRLPTMRETRVQSLGWEDPLEKEMATHSIFMPGKSHGPRSLVGYSPWGHKESDTPE